VRAMGQSCGVVVMVHADVCARDGCAERGGVAELGVDASPLPW